MSEDAAKYINELYAVIEKAKKYDELIRFNGPRVMSCSFCGKEQEHVKKIIVGERVAICDECVALCNELLEKHESEEHKIEKKDDN